MSYLTKCIIQAKMRYLRGSYISELAIADDFYEAYERCFKGDDNNHIVVIPAFVNGLFACELYFKILLGKKIKKVVKKDRHNLNKLFEVLDNNIKEDLFKVKCDPRYSLESLLNNIGDGFIVWRYCFENDNESFGSGRPFEYTENFLRIYLPAIKDLACKYYTKDN